MRSWYLDHPDLSGHVDIARATGLISSIGNANMDAFAYEVLKLLDDIPAIGHCTVFAYEDGHRPRIMSATDRNGSNYIRDISESYSTRFHTLDSNHDIITAEAIRKNTPSILLHHQTIADVQNTAYRAICYREPNVTDRLSFLVQPSNDVWLAINLYSDRPLAPAVMQRLEALGPLIANAAKQHYALHVKSDDNIAQLVLMRLHRFCPDLSKRELDVLRGVLEGRTAQDIGELIGVRPSSVVTYQKRAYRRLGISGQRELFALCLSLQRG
jgi:DNA-binding CsgD family transcriptional regulator